MVVPVEGQLAAQQQEHDDSHRPQISLLAVPLHGQHFRSYIGERAACSVHLLLREDHLRQPEVGDLEVVQLLSAQDVLGLQVAVHDAQVVQVGHALQQRLDQLRRLELREARPAHDSLEQLTPLQHLHHDVDVAFALIQAFHPDDVGMVDQLQDSDLGAQQGLLLGFDRGFVYDLHRTMHPCHLVDALADYAEAPSAQLLADHVVVLDRHHLHRRKQAQRSC